MKSYRVHKYKSIRRDGGLYQSNNPFIRWYFYKRLDIALDLSELSKDDNVLEIGCQEGFLIPSLVENANRVFACDVDTSIWGEGKDGIWCTEIHSPCRVLSLGKDLIETEFGSKAINKVLFCYADASRLPFKDNSQDVVFILDCIEHMPSNIGSYAISEAWRVLKEEGLFICSLPIEKGMILIPREVIRRAFGYQGPRSPFRKLIKAAIYNTTVCKWDKEKAGHDGFDYSIILDKINKQFTVTSTSYAPVPIFGTLNPTVIIKAKKHSYKI